MVNVMIDSEDLSVITDKRFAGTRVATYADLLTSDLVRELSGRLSVFDRGLGDPLGLATIADIEPGCLTVPDGVALIRQWIREHRPGPTSYCDRAEWPAVIDALGPLHPWHMISTLDGTANPNGQYPAVVQILGEAQLGFKADLSIVWDDRWHPLPPGLPASTLFELRKIAATIGADAHHLAALVASA